MVTDTDGACLQLNSDPETYNASNPYQDGIMSNNLVEGNVFYNCGDTSGGAAINLAGVEDSIFRNNLVYGAPLTGGIANWDDSYGDQFGCKRNVYYNNLIDCRNCDRHALSFRNGSIGNSFVNNIVITGTKDAIAMDSESNQDLTIDYNVFLAGVFFEDTAERWISIDEWRQETGYDLHSLVAGSLDEVFVNHDAADYHLIAASAARDNGQSIPVTVDFDGNPRPLGSGHDIGPFEFNPVTPSPDRTPPVLTALLPAGTLRLRATQLRLVTDEDAQCKYATVAGLPYTAMTDTFTLTGGTTHNQTITGLTDGTSYTYYVRCKDSEGNLNTIDGSIHFSVDFSSAPAPSGSLLLLLRSASVPKR